MSKGAPGQASTAQNGTPPRADRNSKPVDTSIFIWTPLFPMLSCACALGGMLSGYLTAVLNKHVNPWLPMISEGGAIPPESCIFATLMNLTGFFWWLTSLLICNQLFQMIKISRKPKSKLRFVTYFMIFTGFISGLGMCLVANFQISNIRVVHGYASLLLFFGGMAFCWCHIIMMAILKPRPKWTWIARIALICFVSICVIIHELGISFYVFVSPLRNGSMPKYPRLPPSGVLHVKPGDPYYDNHIIGSVAEWGLGFGYFILVSWSGYDLDVITLDLHVKKNKLSPSPKKRETIPKTAPPVVPIDTLADCPTISNMEQPLVTGKPKSSAVLDQGPSPDVDVETGEVSDAPIEYNPT